MAKKQYFGLKYPFTNNCIEKYELDLNKSQTERVTSELLHLLFTPRGQRLRKPNYGTDLIKFIFEPNDGSTWQGVKNEIQDSVQTWIRGVVLNDIQVVASEDGLSIYVRIDYSVTEGNYTYTNSVVVEV
jgi:uncharacterized protein